MPDLTDLKRHPLSAEYRDISGPAWARFVAKFKRMGFLPKFPIMLQGGQVLDGWQRLRACIELKIEPEFDVLPPEYDPQDYVQSVNDERRHETSEERLERIERVAKRRQGGESVRTIAKEEGISIGQVQRDLEQADPGVSPPDTPEPEKPKEPPKVTGRDGKTYSATKPKPLCKSCAHRKEVGKPLVENCEDCAVLRRPKPPKANDAPPKAGKPKFSDKKFEKIYGPLPRFFDDRARATGKGPTRKTTLQLSGNCHDVCMTLLKELIDTYKLWKKQS